MTAPAKTGSGEGEFKAPAGIGIDKNDNIYVTEIGNDRVQVFDKTGKFLTAFGKKGSGDGEFGNTHGMIVDKALAVENQRAVKQGAPLCLCTHQRVSVTFFRLSGLSGSMPRAAATASTSR